MEAVKQNDHALECAAEELKGDRGVVLEAVKQDGEALEYAAEELKLQKLEQLEVLMELEVPF